MRKIIFKARDLVLDIFYPKRCAICDCTIRGNRGVCNWCKPLVKLVKEPTCMKCGKMLKSEEDNFCFDCKRSSKNFERGFAIFEYEYIKKSLYRFKYTRRPEYSEFYARWGNYQFGAVINRLGIEVLIPVPIHRNRERKRGYNQSEEFAKSLSKLVGIPVENNLILRQINTAPLKRMKAEQRQKNLKKAFKLARNDVKFRKVCIVDDIYTTGATIDSIAMLLKSAGVREVYFVTVAIGMGI